MKFQFLILAVILGCSYVTPPMAPSTEPATKPMLADQGGTNKPEKPKKVADKSPDKFPGCAQTFDGKCITCDSVRLCSNGSHCDTKSGVCMTVKKCAVDKDCSSVTADTVCDSANPAANKVTGCVKQTLPPVVVANLGPDPEPDPLDPPDNKSTNNKPDPKPTKTNNTSSPTNKELDKKIQDLSKIVNALDDKLDKLTSSKEVSDLKKEVSELKRSLTTPTNTVNNLPTSTNPDLTDLKNQVASLTTTVDELSRAQSSTPSPAISSTSPGTKMCLEAGGRVRTVAASEDCGYNF